MNPAAPSTPSAPARLCEVCAQPAPHRVKVHNVGIVVEFALCDAHTLDGVRRALISLPAATIEIKPIARAL